MIVIALGTGFGLSWFALNDGRLFGAFHVGPWSTWPSLGSPDPDPYAHAYLARTGTLHLGLSEGVAFTAQTDSTGQLLDRACRYRIEGPTPVASFWTLQALDTDGVNIARPDGPIELRSSLVARNEAGNAVLYVSPTLAPMNWLETTGAGPFTLTLTLYDTTIFSAIGESVQALPTITREAC